VLRRVIVNTKDGKAFRGVLCRKGRDYLAVTGAEMLMSKGVTVPMDGEVVVLRENVAFMQVIQVVG
jgi:hypothetical protein